MHSLEIRPGENHNVAGINSLFIKLSLKSEYIRNVLTLTSGTAVAQAILIAVTPLLTRIYTPDQFGLFGVYIALISIGTMIASGRLEMAVLVARKDSEALQLALMSFLIAGVLCLLLLLIIFFHGSRIASFSGQPAMESWLYIVPFSIFFFSAYKVILRWLNRKKQYQLMSHSRIIQSSSMSVLQVIIGLTTKSMPGLALADCIGRAISLMLVFQRIKKTIDFPKFNPVKQIALLRRYKKFPLFGTPASILNLLSLQVPYVIIPVIFSSTVAGLYFLVFRVLMMPIALLGESIMEVFRNKAMDGLKEHGTCKPLYVKTCLTLVIIGLPPTLLLIFFGPELFALIFGEEWRVAGVYSKILAPMALFRLVCAPLSGVLLIREKLRLILLLQSFFFVMVALSLFIGWNYKDPIILMTFLSVSGCLFYLTQAVTAFRLCTVK